MWFPVYDEKWEGKKNKIPKFEEHQEAWNQNVDKSSAFFELT